MRNSIFLRLCCGIVLLIGVSAAAGCGNNGFGPVVASRETLGEFIFNDTSLSTPPGQACAACHNPDGHFVDTRGTVTSQGAVTGRFGNRQAPSCAYAAYSPEFHYDTEAQDYIGGQFWDGRAATLEDQAKGPFLNPIEMNNADKAEVVRKVASGQAAAGMKTLYGDDIFNQVDRAYDAIAEVIAAFERTAKVSPFSSKYDAYLAGKATLTAEETRGLEVFNDPMMGNCSACHPSTSPDGVTSPLFTDYSYDNLGLPRNYSNPFYSESAEFNPDGDKFIDEGLSKTTKRDEDRGRFKVPTLRNIAVTEPYFHNGVFTSLRQVVDFYSDRDTGMFGAPEEPEGVNDQELGNLGLTDQDKSDLIAFLRTLTDGYSIAP